MSTFVAGPLRRSVSGDTFADITAAPILSFDGGLTFDGDLTAEQQHAVWCRMTSRDDADQAARANIATLNDCLNAATLPPELEPLRALVTALADYTLGV